MESMIGLCDSLFLCFFFRFRQVFAVFCVKNFQNLIYKDTDPNESQMSKETKLTRKLMYVATSSRTSAGGLWTSFGAACVARPLTSSNRSTVAVIVPGDLSTRLSRLLNQVLNTIFYGRYQSNPYATTNGGHRHSMGIPRRRPRLHHDEY